MKHKKVWLFIATSVLVLAILLLVPLSVTELDGGSTRISRAGLYTIVEWKSLELDLENETMYRFEKTSVYWFGDAKKELRELLALEKAAPDWKDYLKPMS